MLRRLLLSALLALGGCYHGPGTDDPTFKSGGSTLPLGILQPRHDGSGTGAVAGIYPSAQTDDPYCCWVGASASFEVRVPPNGRDMIVTTFLPSGLEIFKRRKQSVTVAVDGGTPLKYRLRDGVSFLHVPLRPQPRERIADVVLDAAFTFTPRKEKINGDARELSFYLKSVRISSAR